MFNRKKPQQTPPRELTPWELAQQNSPRDRANCYLKEPCKKVKKKKEPKPKRRNQSHKVLRMQHS